MQMGATPQQGLPTPQQLHRPSTPSTMPVAANGHEGFAGESGAAAVPGELLFFCSACLSLLQLCNLDNGLFYLLMSLFGVSVYLVQWSWSAPVALQNNVKHSAVDNAMFEMDQQRVAVHACALNIFVRSCTSCCMRYVWLYSCLSAGTRISNPCGPLVLSCRNYYPVGACRSLCHYQCLVLFDQITVRKSCNCIQQVCVIQSTDECPF